MNSTNYFFFVNCWYALLFPACQKGDNNVKNAKCAHFWNRLVVLDKVTHAEKSDAMRKKQEKTQSARDIWVTHLKRVPVSSSTFWGLQNPIHHKYFNHVHGIVMCVRTPTTHTINIFLVLTTRTHTMAVAWYTTLLWRKGIPHKRVLTKKTSKPYRKRQKKQVGTCWH